jgi:hypothetical protein
MSKSCVQMTTAWAPTASASPAIRIKGALGRLSAQTTIGFGFI